MKIRLKIVFQQGLVIFIFTISAVISLIVNYFFKNYYEEFFVTLAVALGVAAIGLTIGLASKHKKGYGFCSVMLLVLVFIIGFLSIGYKYQFLGVILFWIFWMIAYYFYRKYWESDGAPTKSHNDSDEIT